MPKNKKTLKTLHVVEIIHKKLKFRAVEKNSTIEKVAHEILKKELMREK